ncbi:hypothetical protein B0H19DRAFT_540788 [Mycena capillaripes]|nr:hypothetical protein B0H19DRAFT_540788 [Mycena capillaripes]
MFAMGTLLQCHSSYTDCPQQVLDPHKKFSHFNQHWSPELQGEAMENMEETFKARDLEMHAQRTAQTLAPRTKSTTTEKAGLRALTPDDEEDGDGLSETHVDPTKPWRDEYNLYFNTRENVPIGISTIE